MAFQFFAPKTLGSLTIGTGALTGGGTIYWYQMPRTWRELLIKEGFLFLNSEYDYKGMYHDQKDSQEWKGESSLSSSNDNNVKTNAENYCKGKLDVELPSSSDSNYSDTRKKLIAFCTSAGINTVKARLIQSKKSNWIEEKDDEKWKTVFAVYRYNSEFINWLKEDDKSGNASLNQSSNVSEYTKLKNACEKLLKLDYRKVPEDHIKYGSWWCVELGYSTIKEKIKKTDSDWEELEASSSEWTNLKNKWKDTAQVKKWANKANGETTENENKDLTEDSLKKLCESANVTSKLSENDSYKEKYTVIKSVCKKSK